MARSSASEDGERHDVIVIGAGAAGLMAARRLREAGRRVVVLEARDRTGGRILTHRTDDIPVPVELGAEFLHGDAKLTRALLAEAGVEMVDIEPAQWEARDGSVGPARMWRDVERVLDRLDAQREPDRSFAEFLASEDARGLSDETIESASAFIEGFHAADLRRVSERALAREPGLEGAIQAARVPAGYDRLTLHLARPLEDALLRGHVVERVAWTPDGVSVRGSTDGGSFALDATACVVTAPLQVLRRTESGPGAIAFVPAVPALEAAHRAVAAGNVVRIPLVLDRAPATLLRPRMPADRAALTGEFFLHTPSEPFNVYWPTTPASAPVLLAWAGGGRTTALTEDSAVEVAIEGLERAAGLRLREAVRSTTWHDWRTDPFSRGAYSYTVVGGTEPEPLAVAGTLFFAGEAFARGTIGTVEGALETGAAAAEALLAGRSG